MPTHPLVDIMSLLPTYLNNAIIKARELPICSMLEVLRMILNRWCFERRNETAYQVTDFTKTVEGIIRERIENSRSI